MGLWDTPSKDIPRQIVMRRRPVNTVRPRAAGTALSTPAGEMLCTEAGLRSGLFDHLTAHIFAEHDPQAQRKITNKIRKMSCAWEPRLWCGELHDLPLRAYLENQGLEFAYLDLCSALNPRISRWIYTELGPALANGATVAVTLQRSWRRSPYMKWWCEVSGRRNTDARKLWQAADNMIQESKCSGSVGDLASFYDDSATSATDTFSLSHKAQSKWAARLLPEYHDSSVDALSSFMVLFPQHTFELEACIEYKRTPTTGAAMTTFVMTNFQRVDSPTISRQMIKQLGENVLPRLRLASF